MLKSSNSNKTQEQQIERPKQDKINQKDSSNPKQNEHPQDPNTSETQNTSKPGLLKKILTKTKSNLKGLMFQAEASNRLQKLKSSSEVDPVLYEELLLLNEECQRKYFYEGTCSMKFVEKISPGNIFNEKILLQDYRSPRTFVALTDCSVLALNKNVFAKIFEELVARINFRRDFLQHFFHYPSQVMISRLLKCTREVEYRMNDKIYAEGEKSKGVYIITSGEVKVIFKNTLIKHLD
jgi:cAMP-binding proteins - catabolite gene activator and regulatory subunit of cAMP-dependent protein kinases